MTTGAHLQGCPKRRGPLRCASGNPGFRVLCGAGTTEMPAASPTSTAGLSPTPPTRSFALLGVPKPGCFKPGPWLFAISMLFCPLWCSFAPCCALFCTLFLRSFVFAFIRALCVRLRLERPRLGTSDLWCLFRVVVAGPSQFGFGSGNPLESLTCERKTARNQLLGIGGR